MARNLFIVNATQVVTSQSHPEGLFSVVSDYPKTFDSLSYAAEANPADAALRAAKAEYHDRIGKNYASNTRAMWAVTLEMADGTQILKESEGDFPGNQNAE